MKFSNSGSAIHVFIVIITCNINIKIRNAAILHCLFIKLKSPLKPRHNPNTHSSPHVFTVLVRGTKTGRLLDSTL